MNSIWTKKGV